LKPKSLRSFRGDSHSTGEACSRYGREEKSLIEQALLHHLQVLDALPAEVIVNPRIVVSRKSGQEILKRIARPQRPTKQLRALMRNGN